MSFIEPGTKLELVKELPKEIKWELNSVECIVLDHIEKVLSKQLHLKHNIQVTYLGTSRVTREHERWGELQLKIHTFKYDGQEYFLETPKTMKLTNIFKPYVKNYSQKETWKELEASHSSLQSLVAKLGS